MRKKIYQSLITLAASLTVASAFVPIYSSAVYAAEKQELTDEDLKLLREVYDAIQNQYIEEVDKKQLLEGALKGMVSAVGDPYSEYFDAEQAEAFEEDISASFEGIGVQFAIKNGKPVIISPIDDTPADKAGLLPNDVILKADDTELTDKTTNEIVKLIRGPKGSEVKLNIQRGSQVFDVTLVRDTIPVHSVIGELDKENAEVGYIRITQFAEKTADELMASIKDLREKGAKRFIFDLRSNPGGLLDQALKITNMFSKEGDTLMQVEERGKEPNVYTANPVFGLFKVTEPYVFLINEGSASASEILAAVVAENTHAALVGVKTFGKGTVQTVTNQSELGELKLTVAKWLTPNGTWVHEKGVEPTVVVEQPEVARAIQLDTAMELKKGQSSDYVASLALILKALGYEVASENYFDDGMESAVKQFQTDNQLEANGVVTGDTAQLLIDQIRQYLEENDVQYAKAKEMVLKAE